MTDVLDQVRMAARFAGGLARLLRRPPLDHSSAASRLTRQLDTRVDSFLRVAERGIYGNPRSPYLPLLTRAGVGYGDLAELVRREGLEAALATLDRNGVYVTLDEFKGRRPIQRAGFEHACRPSDFDNPLLVRQYETRTGGSRSAGTRLVVDLDLIDHEACHELLFRHASGAHLRPSALWRPAPPGFSGLANALRMARLGAPPDRWFSQQPVTAGSGRLGQALFAWLTVGESRLLGRPIPMPEHVPLERAVEVAQWAAACKRDGTPGFLDTSASCGVRVCLAAREHGLDIAGTLLRLGSEPYTPGKAEVIARAGCRALVHYAMVEAGRLAVACAAPNAADDGHLLVDKVAVVQREVMVGTASVPAFFITSLLPSAPRLMLNVEVGDSGVLERRSCGCPFDRLGFDWHIHTVRSYEKLTSEGMHFVGADLADLLERVLPDRFGGTAADYQLVEEEVDALPRVSLVVSPRVGPLDDQLVVQSVLDALSKGPHRAAARMMADQWRQGRTLQVIRREPYVTPAGKVLSLHLAAPPKD